MAASSTPVSKRAKLRYITGTDTDDVAFSSPLQAESSPAGPSTHTRKCVADFEFVDDGVRIRILQPGTDGLPAQLGVMLKKMVGVRNGVGVVSLTFKFLPDSLLQPAIEEEARRNPTVDGFEGFHYQEAVKRDAFGPTPSITSVLEIVKWTAERFTWNLDEAAWNYAVHSPILRLALPMKGLVGFTPTTPTSKDLLVDPVIYHYSYTTSSGWPRFL
ncbi:hypothetical protein AAE478_002960 [Parahypoxylon ruwenzoriense]